MKSERCRCTVLTLILFLIIHIKFCYTLQGYAERNLNKSSSDIVKNENLTKISVDIAELNRRFGSAFDLTKTCAERKCIAKCCPTKQHIIKGKRCQLYDGDLDFSDAPVYDRNIVKTGKNVKDTFHIVSRRFLNMSLGSAFDVTIFNLSTYLTEEGIAYVEFPNAYRRWTPINSSNFCVDYQLPNVKNKLSSPEPRYWVILDSDESPETNEYFVSSAMLVSCVFLALVLVVYSMLPELRNLCGMILMAYVASLMAAFLLLATLQILTMLDQHTKKICLGSTFLIYFAFLSSFCWMNVMSFDIWWTFRGYAKARPIHRRGEKFKFLMYCLYGWGVPLAMTVILGLLDKADLRHIPWFITPKITVTGCFLEGGERLLYLYVPMLILILSNWLFFLMTAYNVWRLNRGTAVLDYAAAGTPAAHRTHRHRLIVYLKLSLIMGISWVLEVVSSLKPELQVWYLTDAYNLLLGVAIFLIFVCKRKIFVKLATKIRGNKKKRYSPYSKSQTSSTTDSDTSQDAPLQICTYPKGSGF